jgi:hypothetical protein
MRLHTGRPVLVVSPHLDDAMLSAAALLQPPDPAQVLNVLAGAPDPPVQGWWDAACGFADSDAALAARRSEEAAAFAGLAVAVDDLPLLDSQYIEGPRADADRAVLAEALAEWLTAHAEGVLALPAGAGRPRPTLRGRVIRRLRRQGLEGAPAHADHTFARDVGLEVAARAGVSTVLLYEEIPYSLGRRSDRLVRRVAGRMWTASPVELQIDLQEKARRLTAYASQLSFLAGRDLRDVLPGRERYWQLTSRVRPRCSA